MRAIGKLIWRFMVIFSFIVNIVLVLVLLVAGLFIFQIKDLIAQPLITGLHSSFVGLENSTIDWTIPVRADVPVKLDIPLEQDTIVVLTEDVPLDVIANITAPALSLQNARVRLSLPKGQALPVRLSLNVPVRDQSLPVSLDVRAVIPLSKTQLRDPIENLRLLFEPLAVGLHNLPDNFPDAGTMVTNTLSGNPPNLLAPNAYSRNPWPGYSTTAGVNYETLLAIPPPLGHRIVDTGIVPVGGIPPLDEQVRPNVYQQGGPDKVNKAAKGNMAAQSIAPYYYDGTMAQHRDDVLKQGAGGAQPTLPNVQGTPSGTPGVESTLVFPTPFPTVEGQPTQAVSTLQGQSAPPGTNGDMGIITPTPR